MKASSRKSAKPGQPSFGDTATSILDVAERLAQTRGYNGFSYADIAEQLGVTKASLHYHFPSKEALGRTLIDRYEGAFSASLASIDLGGGGAEEKLRRYVALYDDVLSGDRVCLCGMLAAEYETLPAPMQSALQRFFDTNETWLAEVLTEGRRSGIFAFPESARERAGVVICALEGAMLMARSYRDPRRFTNAARCVVANLVVRPTSIRTRLRQRT